MATENGDNLQRFIELTEECRIDGIAEFLAQACEVEAGMADDEGDESTANAWSAVAPEFRKLASRAAALYGAARRRAEEAALDEDARAEGNFIGTVTTYVGTEWPGLTGQRVRIAAVMGQRGRLLIKDNTALAEYGGVRPFDRIEVQPLIGKRVSFVSSDPRAVDLECFASLRAPKAKPEGRTGDAESPMRTTKTIAGHAFTLVPGRRYSAWRPIADGRAVFTVIVKDVESGNVEAEVVGLTYDDANDLLLQFNNGPSSWEGRLWEP